MPNLEKAPCWILTIPKRNLECEYCIIPFIALLASGCSDPTDGSLSGQELYPGNPPGARWYSSEQVASGSQIFEMNCAECHGANAEGIYVNWKQKLPDGSFPPPPLDGSAPRVASFEICSLRGYRKWGNCSWGQNASFWSCSKR